MGRWHDDLVQIQDALNNRQHQSSMKASITAKTVMAIRRGKSAPMPAGGEDGSGVGEMLLVGMGAGTFNCFQKCIQTYSF